MNIERLIYDHRNELTKYAARNADKYRLPDSTERHTSEYVKKGENLYQAVHLKFFARFENFPEELEELLNKNLYLPYIKASIRNKAFDEKDKLKHTPTALVNNEIQQDGDDEEYTDTLLGLSDNKPEQDKIVFFRDLLRILSKRFNEEEEDLAYLCAKGLSSEEISKELDIDNANTVRTNIASIRHKHGDIKDLLNEY